MLLTLISSLGLIRLRQMIWLLNSSHFGVFNFNPSIKDIAMKNQVQAVVVSKQVVAKQGNQEVRKKAKAAHCLPAEFS